MIEIVSQFKSDTFTDTVNRLVLRDLVELKGIDASFEQIQESPTMLGPAHHMTPRLARHESIDQ